VKNNLYGHLVAFGVRRDLNHYDALYLETTSSIVALEFLKRISVQEVENKYKAEFFEDLISFDEKRKLKAIERANYYRFDKDAFFSIFTIRISKTESMNSLSDEEYNQIITKAKYMVDMVCKEEGRIYIIASKGKKINVLFMWKSVEDHRKFATRISNSIKESLDQKVAQSHYRVGIGRVYKGIDQVYKSLKDAEKAVEAAKTYVNQQIIDFDTLGIYKIFCQDHLKDELLNFYKTTLEPLVLYDRKRDTELVKSLMIYFETNGNLKKMSELLFTHYNTVLYRINRIQEITGKDLENEGDRYGLQTALKIMRILDL
jgi:purine catabolism regulator